MAKSGDFFALPDHGAVDLEVEFQRPELVAFPTGLVKAEVPRAGWPDARIGDREMFRFEELQFELEVTAVSEDVVIFESVEGGWNDR